MQAAVVEMETSFEEHNRAAEGMQAELEAQIQAALSAKAGQEAEVAKLQQDKADQGAQLEQVCHFGMMYCQPVWGAMACRELLSLPASCARSPVAASICRTDGVRSPAKHSLVRERLKT